MELLIEGIDKRYKGAIWGLRDCSLGLKPGILGLVGPNGAGKSTLLRLLVTVTRPTEGKVTWNGTAVVRDPDRLRSVLGYVPRNFGVYPHLNAVEFLEYLAALKGVHGQSARRRIDELLHAAGLAGVCRRPLSRLFGGMKPRVGIAQALLNDPQLLIADEPTSGPDPEERVHFRRLLADLAGERIVILSTHIVSAFEAAATEVAILDSGRLLWHSPPEALLRSVEGRVWEWIAPSGELDALRRQYPISSAIRCADGVHLRTVADTPPRSDAKSRSATLEDAYLDRISTGREQAEECLV